MIVKCPCNVTVQFKHFRILFHFFFLLLFSWLMLNEILKIYETKYGSGLLQWDNFHWQRKRIAIEIQINLKKSKSRMRNDNSDRIFIYEKKKRRRIRSSKKNREKSANCSLQCHEMYDSHIRLVLLFFFFSLNIFSLGIGKDLWCEYINLLCTRCLMPFLLFFAILQSN